MGDYAISVQDVRKSFGQEEILHGITVDFEAGKTHGIVGFNGSGKTVLFKCICGFLEPTSGRVFVGGKEIGKDIDFPESLGLIIENPGFLQNMSGFRNLKLLAQLNKKISDETIKETIRKVGLDPDMKKPVAKYSLGMRQRLGIAQAIMEDPDILILDEPFNGLDKKGVSEIHQLIRDLKAKGKTIILTSHNAVDIDTLADDVWEMDAGKLEMMK
ncbi:MAG: ATP-binding cassette domain-containing protein [Lachnospiraceae bacterium]|nr:ATP-binding cassette domain-containing protein [Lachnospiraceae bacterium]